MSADVLQISDYRPGAFHGSDGGSAIEAAVSPPRPSRVPETNDAPAKRTAASRLLALLDAFGTGEGPKTLSELSRNAGLSLTTTHRLVHELRAWGGVDVDERGQYRLSTKLLALASGSTKAFDLRERALPHLVELNRVVGISVQLGVRDGTDVLYLEALRTIPTYTGQNRIGGRMPLHTTATGLALLAYEDARVIDDYLAAPLARYTSHTLADAASIRRELEHVRHRRYVIADRTVTPEASSIAAPVVGENGRVVAAVGILYYTSYPDPRRLVQPLLTAVTRISQALVETRSKPDPRTVAFNRRRAGLL